MAQGDQIYVYREFFNLQGVYEHHGIDCGDGSIIHYRKPSEIIEKTSLATFTRGNKIYLKQYIKEFCFIPEIVVQRAISRLGEQKYNLLFNNCEHFATWCKTGISYSEQIRDFVPTISRLKVDSLAEPLQEALGGTDKNNAQQLLNQALTHIRVVWDQIQPQYKQARQEMTAWEQVAQKALQQNREDLARAALQRKLYYKQEVSQLEEKLAELAKMTEKLIRNSQKVT
jgi:hypothetical protein